MQPPDFATTGASSGGSDPGAGGWSMAECRCRGASSMPIQWPWIRGAQRQASTTQRQDQERRHDPQAQRRDEGLVLEENLLGAAARVVRMCEVDVPEEAEDDERDRQHHEVV